MNPLPILLAPASFKCFKQNLSGSLIRMPYQPEPFFQFQDDSLPLYWNHNKKFFNIERIQNCILCMNSQLLGEYLVFRLMLTVMWQGLRHLFTLGALQFGHNWSNAYPDQTQREALLVQARDGKFKSPILDLFLCPNSNPATKLWP